MSCHSSLPACLSGWQCFNLVKRYCKRNICQPSCGIQLHSKLSYALNLEHQLLASSAERRQQFCAPNYTAIAATRQRAGIGEHVRKR